jgi:hypothetical protein
MGTTTTPAPAPTPPRVTPTASQPVRIPWGHWLSQALANETKIIEAAAQGGANLALHAIPMGTVVSMFIGPQLIKQYVDMGLAALEGIVDPLSVEVPVGNTVLATVANLINKNEPEFAAWVGEELGPMIEAALGKLGVKF